MQEFVVPKSIPKIFDILKITSGSDKQEAYLRDKTRGKKRFIYLIYSYLHAINTLQALAPDEPICRTQ